MTNISEHIDTMTLQFRVNPCNKDIIFNDFKDGLITGANRNWKSKLLHRPKYSKALRFHGIQHRYYGYVDKFYYKPYPFVGGYDGYSINYCHYKYRDDYVLVTLQHKVVEDKDDVTIVENTYNFLDSIGIDTELLELDDKLNRIDFKRDAEATNQVEIDAFFNAISKCRTSFYNVDKITYTTAIKYKPTESYTEIVVYDKWAEMNARAKKHSHVDLDISNFKNVIRTELRLKNKRLNCNKTATFKMDKHLSNYFRESVIDKCYKRYVEPIFYTEPFFRIDFALQLIETDNRLSDNQREKLSYLVSEINKRGFTEAKASYKYCDDTFEKHIKLLRKIGINPLTFDENIDIKFVVNFTLKEMCRHQ